MVKCYYGVIEPWNWTFWLSIFHRIIVCFEMTRNFMAEYLFCIPFCQKYLFFQARKSQIDYNLFYPPIKGVTKFSPNHIQMCAICYDYSRQTRNHVTFVLFNWIYFIERLEFENCNNKVCTCKSQQISNNSANITSDEKNDQHHRQAFHRFSLDVESLKFVLVTIA